MHQQLESFFFALTPADIFADNPTEFSSLFRRILSMTLDYTLSATIRTHLLSFLISAFQSLDTGIVRKECATLVSISIWHNISSVKKRDQKLDQTVQLRKAWRAAAKRYDAADESTKARLRFERSWLFTLVLDFFNQLYNETTKQGAHNMSIPKSRLTLNREHKILSTFHRVPSGPSKSATNKKICQHAFTGFAYSDRNSDVSSL